MIFHVEIAIKENSFIFIEIKYLLNYFFTELNVPQIVGT